MTLGKLFSFLIPHFFFLLSNEDHVYSFCHNSVYIKSFLILLFVFSSSAVPFFFSFFFLKFDPSVDFELSLVK